MPAERLSALDVAFLDVERPTAHMHVGWAATFAPPERGPRPRFEDLRAHVAGRMGRAPRYRQKLAEVPLDLEPPLWVDDERFDVARHVLQAPAREIGQVVDHAMSRPLARDRPLWELWIADELEDGRIGVVGKAHHCMVDGLAAVELATLLLDPTPDVPAAEPDGWRPAPVPGPADRIAHAVAERTRQGIALGALAARSALDPSLLVRMPVEAARAARALARALAPAPAGTPLNPPSSPLRHLACTRRPLEDLRRVKRAFGTTVNDVLLAACAGALRGWFEQDRGERAVDLKTMVPVSVRDAAADGALGNRISFVFVDLPCTETDPLARLRRIHDEVADRRAAGEPEGASAVLELAEYVPRPVQRGLAQLVGGGPGAFNLVVSNIPGPGVPLWMRGCRLEAAHPVVPLAEHHALSIGMTTVGDDACFGLYADRAALADADRIADHLNAALDELVELSERVVSRSSAGRAAGRST